LSASENKDSVVQLLQAGHITLGKNYSPVNPPEIDFNRWRELLTDTAAVDEIEKHYRMFENTVVPALDITEEFKQMDTLYETEFTALRARAQAAKESIQVGIDQVELSHLEGLNLKDELVQGCLNDDPELERTLELNMLAGRWDPEEEEAGDNDQEVAPSKPNKTDLFWDAQIAQAQEESERAPSVNPSLESDARKVAGL
jgi:hypothetical protein